MRESLEKAGDEVDREALAHRWPPWLPRSGKSCRGVAAMAVGDPDLTLVAPAAGDRWRPGELGRVSIGRGGGPGKVIIAAKGDDLYGHPAGFRG